MSSEVRHCPYPNPLCRFEARYDTSPVSDAAIDSIAANLEDDEVVGALEAASGKFYRGESCQRCGAWFPASGAATEE